MRRTSRTALFLSLTLLAGTAAADPSAADRATARTLAQEGQQALDTKKYSAAIDKFSRADSLVHAPTLLIGLARAQLGMGKLVEAQESFNRIIREGIAPGSPRSWNKALDDATKEVDAITARLPWVTITVLGPTNPEVVIDSTPVPAASLGVKRPVNPGSHTIKASAEGFLPSEKTMIFSEGQSITVGLELEQAPADATPVAATTATPETVRPSGSGRKTAAFVAFGVGGAGLIVGGITGVLALGKFSKLKDECPNKMCDPDTEGAAVSSYHTVGNISTVGFIVGGVGIATGTILLLTASKESAQSATRASWSPFIGVGSAGVMGKF